MPVSASSSVSPPHEGSRHLTTWSSPESPQQALHAQEFQYERVPVRRTDIDSVEDINSASATFRCELAELRGQLVQESAMAEDLRATCEAKAVIISGLQEKADFRRETELGNLSNPVSPTLAYRGDDGPLAEQRLELLTLQRQLRQLEQQFRRTRAALHDSDVFSESLETQCGDMQRNIDRADDAARQLSKECEHLTRWETMSAELESARAPGAEASLEAKWSEINTWLDKDCREHEAWQWVDNIQFAQEGLQADIAQGVTDEARMAQDVQAYQVEVRHLHSDTASLAKRASGPNSATQHARSELESLLGPHCRGLPLRELAAHVESEWAELCALRSRPASGEPGKLETEVLRDRRQAETLRQDLEQAESSAEYYLRGIERAELELARVRSSRGKLSPALGELPVLRRENAALLKQQKEWQRSQPRMMRLVEDLQREKRRGMKSQEILAERLVQLKSDTRISPVSARSAGTAPTFGSPGSVQSPARLGDSVSSTSTGEFRRNGMGEADISTGAGGRRLEAIRDENSELLARLGALEEEKMDLIQSQEDLIQYIKTKVLPIQQALHLELS